MHAVNVSFAGSLLRKAAHLPEFGRRLNAIEKIIEHHPLIGRDYVPGFPAFRALNAHYRESGEVRTWQYIWMPLADFLPEAERDEVFVFHYSKPFGRAVLDLTEREQVELVREVVSLYTAVEA